VPYKHSESRSHKCTKPKFKVTNWREYNDSLRQRGDITIWFTQAAINEWRPEKTGARGRPQEYSDHAIETAILIRQVFHLPLRQTEGFMNSMTCLMSAAISIPDFSSISRRSIELPRHVLSGAGNRQFSHRRLHGPEGLRQGRVASGETRGSGSQNVAQAAFRGGREPPDSCVRTHDTRGWRPHCSS
jgi:hypothetical protein